MQQQQTYDLRGQLTSQSEARDMYTSDEEQSVLEDDSDGEDRNNSGGEEYMDEDDDRSSELSIPNESIDFDLVYALHSFAATVEGQANVVKGDSLFLMDDSNSYWWLVRVLKTQEVGYIPAENIETPFERLARLNKHRNVDLASATQAEFNAEGKGDRLRKEEAAAAAAGNTARFAASPSPTPGNGPRSTSRASASSKSSRRSVFFTPAFHVHRYPPAVWHDDEEDDEDAEWDDEGYSDEDPEIAEAFPSSEDPRLQNMEPDDGMSWEDGAVDAMRGGAPPPPLALLPGGQQPGLRMQTSREQLLLGVDAPSSASPVSPRTFDPLMATETRKLSATPNIARGADEDGRLVPSTQSGFQQQPSQQQQQAPQGPMLPSAVMQQQAEERNRTREEIEILKEEARKRGKVVPGGPSTTPSGTPTRPGAQGQQAAQQGPSTPQGGKLRKEKTPEKAQAQQAQESPAAGQEEKGTKKRSLFSSIMGRSKKDKKSGSSGGIDSADVMRASDDSARSSGLAAQQAQQGGAPQAGRGDNGAGGRDVVMQDGTQSPVTEAARAQQANYRNSTNPRTGAALQAQMRGQAAAQAITPVITQSPIQEPGTPQQIQRGTSQDTSNSQSPQDSSPLSQYSSTLRQRDQAQQAAYLNRSPASSSEVRPSYGLMSASSSSRGTPFGSMGSSGSSLAPSDSTAGAPGRRPRPGSLVLSPSSDGPGVPDLSVIRVFAGQHVQTEATFKTVLLNASTSSDELVKQAMQRFRLGDSDDAGDYYLTIKQLEGQSAVLRPHEKPLVVFEELVEAAMEMPKVKRSSVGSISSVASNLSMHPAIKKLPMNDFTDDSAVKFYLNRRLGPEESESEGAYGEEEEETIIAEGPSMDVGPGGFGEGRTGLAVPPHLTINNNGVGAERFSSPSGRFALQVIIQPEDLPDDMVFDPQTEAIVFKHTLKNRGPVVQSPDVSMAERRKVFMFPRNVTVAEVIELGLERFGILEGVVDGGDEVEDKLSKRQSSLRVRYALRVQINGQERELSPSHRVIEAFPKPPQMRTAEKPRDTKRRSVDFAQLLGSIDDVQPSDPIFILKRAVAYRSSRNRNSAPLDDVALQHLRRDIAHASEDSSSSADGPQPRQMSKQELIAAQRAASRANQKAMLSAQSNSVRGVDVRLPGNALLRSQRSGADDRMRYSYVDGAGEMYDISDIVEEEWRNVNVEGVSPNGRRNGDLLEGIVGRAASSPSQQAGLGEKLDRVISKITSAARVPDHLDVDRDLEPPPSATGSMHSVSSAYSNVDEEIIRKPAAAAARIMGTTNAGSRSGTPTGRRSVASPTPGSRSATPTAPPPRSHLRNTSVSSATSGTTPTKSSMQMTHSPGKPSLSAPPSRAPSSTGHGSSKLSKKGSMPQIPKDDFGLSTMLALLEVPNLLAKQPPLPPLDDAEALLFGRELDIESLHPDIRAIYQPSFEKLAEMDRILDDLYTTTVMAA